MKDRLKQANVLIVGLEQLGQEICKNLLLAGVLSLVLLDETEIDGVNDLEFLRNSLFFTNKHHAKKVSSTPLFFQRARDPKLP